MFQIFVMIYEMCVITKLLILQLDMYPLHFVFLHQKLEVHYSLFHLFKTVSLMANPPALHFEQIPCLIKFPL